MITDEDLRKLTEIVKRNIEKEFSDKHLSGNLVKTMNVSYGPQGITIEIPAPDYNMKEYFESGVIHKTYKGSYANKLDETGSEFYVYRNGKKYKLIKPHNHIGFVDRVINDSISEWLSSSSYRVLERREDKDGE